MILSEVNECLSFRFGESYHKPRDVLDQGEGKSRNKEGEKDEKGNLK